MNWGMLPFLMDPEEKTKLALGAWIYLPKGPGNPAGRYRRLYRLRVPGRQGGAPFPAPGGRGTGPEADPGSRLPDQLLRTAKKII